VAAGAVTGAITAGLGSQFGSAGQALSGMPAAARAAAAAVVGNLGNYAANKLMGNEAHFSWRSVAASAVTAAITSSVVPKLGEKLNIDLATRSGQMQAGLLKGITGGLVSGSTQQALGLAREVDYGMIFADAFGNMLGSTLSGEYAQEADRYAALRDNSMVSSGGYSNGVVSDYGGQVAGSPYRYRDVYDNIETTTLDPVTVTANVNPWTGGWEYWTLGGNNRWINAYDTMLNAGGNQYGPQVQRWSAPPPKIKFGYSDYLSNGLSTDARMKGVQTGSNRLPGPVGAYFNSAGVYEFKSIGIVDGLAKMGRAGANAWNGLADNYNAEGDRNKSWMAGLDLPFTDKTLGETAVGQRLLSQVVRLPHWNTHGVFEALVPNITGWVDSGFAMPESPLNLWKGQWKGGLNFLSDTVEGLNNLSPFGSLGYLATGYRTDLPRFEVPDSQRLGAAAFDVGGVILGVALPETKLGTLSKLDNAVPNSARTVADVPVPMLGTFEAQRNVLNTFKAGNAVETTYGAGARLYRVGDRNGAYWATELPPPTELQWRMDYAVQGEWNNMSNLYVMDIPKGSSLTGLEGIVGPQRGALFGGKTQVFLDWRRVPEDWITTVPLRRN